MRAHRRTVTIAFAAACLISAFARSVVACTCIEYGTPPCAAYWAADAVFVGTVVSIKEPARETDARTMPQALLSFSVEQPFKGVSTTEVQVGTLWGTSCDQPFKVGQRYLVYAHKSSSGLLENWPCDRTREFEHAGADLDYIRGLSGSRPVQSIMGTAAEQRYTPLPGIKVSVEGVGKTYRATTDEEGRYRIEVGKAGSYRVRLFVPYSAGAMSYRAGVEAKPTEQRTIVEYTVQLGKGQCDYRELDIYKVDLKATAEISGRVVGADGKPVAQLTVYLYTATLGQTFLNGDYEHAQTDGAGRYSFSGLRGGRFWVGVNLGRIPEVDAPYPTTFHPGVQDIAAAPVVLEDGQRLSSVDIKLPPKLVEREVTGMLVWPDGSPVARLSPDAAPGVGPVLSIRDPQWLWYPLNPRRSDGSDTVRTDEQGRFSFIGFEGYTYVIHVHAFNAQGQAVHARHVRLTINGEVRPLRLVLSLLGYGESQDEVLRELIEQP